MRRKRGHPQGRLLREATEYMQTYGVSSTDYHTLRNTTDIVHTLVSKKPHKATELLGITEDANNFTGAEGKHFFIFFLT